MALTDQQLKTAFKKDRTRLDALEAQLTTLAQAVEELQKAVFEETDEADEEDDDAGDDTVDEAEGEEEDSDDDGIE